MNTLKGIKILDLTRVLSGPYSTMILGDLGAEILKIEIPEKGDDTREFGPFYKGKSAYFKSINRNKKSITLNLKKEEGKKILKGLIKESDVIVENFRYGTMDKLGFSYKKVKEMNENIIYASISGFGHTGPYKDKPAYDAIVQAMGGVMSITGQEDGEPTRVGTSIGDITAGIYCSLGIMAALYKRERTNTGEKVDISMLDCQLSLLENAVARYTLTDEVPKPQGNRHSSIVPFESFKTKDSTIMIAIGNNVLWEKFCRVVEEEKLKDEKYNTNDKRNVNYKELKEILINIFHKKTTDEWLEIFEKEDIPVSPINTMEDIVKHEQVRSRNMLTKEKLDEEKDLYVVNSPLKFKNDSKFEYKKSPELGENTEEILKEKLNLSKEKIKELKRNNII